MPWIYSQSLGTLDFGLSKLHAYAGCGQGLNKPEFQDVHNEGPLPQGKYTIQQPIDTKSHGPFVMWLVPDPTNQMFGRSAFGIHGDKKDFIDHPLSASDGCIVTSRQNRQLIWDSGERNLQVVK